MNTSPSIRREKIEARVRSPFSLPKLDSYSLKRNLLLSQSSHRHWNYRKTLKELPIVTKQTNEAIKLSQKCMPSLITNYLNIHFVHHNTILRQHMPKEYYQLKLKLTFTKFGKK